MPGCAPTSISELSPKEKENDFTLYPNPTSGQLTVDSWQRGQLAIYNLQGQVIAIYTITAGKYSFGLPKDLKAGMYMARFIADDGEQKIMQVIFQP